MSNQSLQKTMLIEQYQVIFCDMGSVRSGYGDAAALCDAIARDIEAEYTKHGRLSKEGQALASIAKRCGDAVWAMRDKINDSKDE